MDLRQTTANTLDLYDRIKPKNPASSYTSLASISDYNSGKILAIAAGTQAIYRKYSDDIQDCHAESLVRRAFKRYLIDRIRFVILSKVKVSNNEKELRDLILEECPKELILFVSQFPCGFVKRYKGEEFFDSSGDVVKRKPGRGLVKEGKIHFVEKDDCTSKLKKWISGGFQGKQIKSIFNVTCKIRHIVIGNCEPDGDFDYERYVDEFGKVLSCDTPINVSVDAQIRRDEFLFNPKKKPQPVALACWYTSQDFHSSRNLTERTKVGTYLHEFIVGGRKIGLTKRQCSSSNQLYKLKISNYCFKHDLASIEKAFRDLKL